MGLTSWSRLPGQGSLCLPSSGIESMYRDQAREMALQVKVLAKEAWWPECHTHNKPYASPCLVTMLFLVSSDQIKIMTPLVFPLSVIDSVCLPLSGLKRNQGEVFMFWPHLSGVLPGPYPVDICHMSSTVLAHHDVTGPMCGCVDSSFFLDSRAQGIRLWLFNMWIFIVPGTWQTAFKASEMNRIKGNLWQPRSNYCDKCYTVRLLQGRGRGQCTPPLWKILY